MPHIRTTYTNLQLAHVISSLGLWGWMKCS